MHEIIFKIFFIIVKFTLTDVLVFRFGYLCLSVSLDDVLFSRENIFLRVNYVHLISS